MAQSCAWSLEVLPAPHSPGGVVAVLGGEPPGVSAEEPPSQTPREPLACMLQTLPSVGLCYTRTAKATLSGVLLLSQGQFLQPGLSACSLASLYPTFS